MKILIVKMSALGDVIQMLPAVNDIRTRFPDAAVDWVVEQRFVALPALNPAVRRVLAVTIPQWSTSFWKKSTLRDVHRFTTRLRSDAYDCILDSQGLIKSALTAKLAHGTVYGFTHVRCREAIASTLYDKRIDVSPALDSVEAYRRLASGALDYTPNGPAAYGARVPDAHPALPDSTYAVLLHSSARGDKLWPESSWRDIAKRLEALGIVSVLPWGSAAERERSQRIAEGIAGAIVPPALTLEGAAVLLHRARVVVALDTGLAYLATAVGCPVVRIYGGIDRGRTRLYVPPNGINLGEGGKPPQVQEVAAAIERLLTRGCQAVQTHEL